MRNSTVHYLKHSQYDADILGRVKIELDMKPSNAMLLSQPEISEELETHSSPIQMDGSKKAFSPDINFLLRTGVFDAD